MDGRAVWPAVIEWRRAWPDQEVVDQLPASAVDTRAPLGFGDECGEVPKPGAVPGVGLGVSGRADLRAGWSEQDRGGRGLRLVIQIARDDGRPLPAQAIELPARGTVRRQSSHERGDHIRLELRVGREVQ